jgi:glutamate-1-semialdehyde 2,1-aminomutase
MALSTVFTDHPHQPEVSAAEIAKVSVAPHADLAIALAAATARFVERNLISFRLHEDATKSLPGGNTRTLLHTTPFPISMKSGSGYQLSDEDGHV